MKIVKAGKVLTSEALNAEIIINENARNVYEEYNPSKPYVKGNKVVYNGSSYLNKFGCTNIIPTNNAYWLCITSAGAGLTDATQLPITDTGGYYTSDNTGDALQEIGQKIGDISLLESNTDLVGAINENTSDLRTRSINLLYPPKPLVAPTGDGVTNDTVAIQNILNYAGTNNRTIKIPDRTFLVTALNSGGCKYIYGNGDNSVLKSVVNNDMLTLTADNTIVSNIKLLGVKTVGTYTQKGIVIDGKYNCSVINCKLEDIGGKGVYVLNVGSSNHGLKDGATIKGNTFLGCYRGVECGTNAEYVNILNNIFQKQCTWAIWTIAGNTLINGNNIVKCKNGIYQSDAGNGAHSTITATNINHTFTDNGDSTYTTGDALFFENVAYGEIVTGCSIFDGNIHIVNSSGIDINNCNLGIVNFNFNLATCCHIRHNTITKSYGWTLSNVNSNVDFYDNPNNQGFYTSSSENIKGGQVKGTITDGQTVDTGAQPTIAITAVSNTSHVANNTRIAWWDSVTNKAKNFGFGGNKLTVNIQVHATIASGDISLTNVVLICGSELYIIPPTKYSATEAYYLFGGIIDSEPNDYIYMLYKNASGGTATLLEANSRFVIEGL